MRAIKNLLKAALRKTFELGQRGGVDILPRHFYSEIPDLRSLRTETAWRQPFTMMGVAGMAVESQLNFVRTCLPAEIKNYLRDTDIHQAACAANGEPGYGSVEGDFLFAFVASQRPQEIFQIGCGVSTAICVSAAAHAGYHPRITCVEPYPSPFIKELAQRGVVRLIQKKAQELEFATVEALGAGAFLFVDSTHALGPAGEVSRIILELLPRLKPGARVHFHDILFPYDYDRHILAGTLFFQHESVLLHAFLAHNYRFSVQASFSFLHHMAPQELAGLLPRYKPAPHSAGLAIGPGDFPSSTYLAVIA